MSETAEKARALRVQRLKSALDTSLEHPQAALEALISELESGDQQTSLWEALHAAGTRDKKEDALAAAYVKTAQNQRVQKLEPSVQAAFFLHAADYLQGVIGDVAGADAFLERAARVVPGHPEAYARLERRVESSDDPTRALTLYASAAAAPPIAATTLATRAMHKLLLLPAENPLADDACKKLVVIAQANPRLLQVLEAHCRLTKRFALACTLIEDALHDPTLDDDRTAEYKHRLLDLYLGDAAQPASAMSHVEDLLQRDPGDVAARKVAEKLLAVRDVASRAATALQMARRSQPPPSRSQPPQKP